MSLPFARLLAITILLFGAAAPSWGQVAVPIRDDAMNNPHKHAWDLFLALNHPAKDPKIERGVADETKHIGDAGLTVWETWKLARTEVFLEDGSKPLPWEVLPDGDIAVKSFDAAKPVLLRALAQGFQEEEIKKFSRFDFQNIIAVDPGDGQFDPNNFSGGGETRMNRATFEFIADDNNQLYNWEGQEKFFADVISGVRKPLSLPVDSIEVKAMWIAFSDEDIANGKYKTYHTSKDKDGKLYGLVALHIITKDIPNWFWSSFHHVGDKVPLVPPRDDYGRPSVLKGTVWEYYALSGTQTDFVDSVGRATLLSDPHVENGFERSSCISCHAQASIGARAVGATRPNRLPVFQVQRTNPDVLRPLPGFDLPSNYASIGIPYADQYYDPIGRLRYMQLDFLFSLHIRANQKQ